VDAKVLLFVENLYNI